jgi:serine protease Do
VAIGYTPRLVRTPSSRGRQLILAPALVLVGAGIGAWVAGRPVAPPPEAAAAAEMPSLAPVVRRVRPSVVGVSVLLQPTVLHGGPAAGRVDGSGFVVHERGLIVTNHHLVAEGGEVRVDVPGHGEIPADVVGSDPLTDVAALALRPGHALRLPSLELRPGGEDVEQGDWVVTVSHPLSFANTASVGIVSYTGRLLPEDEARSGNSYLQFSAPVSEGSSGGPLVDLDGRVVGMVTRKHPGGEGVAFAVPSRVLRWVLERMEEFGGLVPRGRLGVTMEPPAPAGAGAVIRGVEAGLPAHAAGLEPDDVVLAFDGRPVLRPEDLCEWVAHSRPGTRVALDVFRPSRGERRVVSVALAEAPRTAALRAGEGPPRLDQTLPHRRRAPPRG